MQKGFSISYFFLFLILSFGARCSIQNFDAVDNFSGTHCPKPSAADTYSAVKSYNLTSGNVSPFTSNYVYNGTNGITPGPFANRTVIAQLLTNVNYGVGHGCGPYTGLQVTVTFSWGTGVIGPQYISFGRSASADFNSDSITDTAYTFLKITPSTGTSGVQATRYASISAGSTGLDGPAGPVACTANLGANTTSTGDQSIVFQFEQTSLFTARFRYSDATNTFSNSDSTGYMGSGCGDGTVAGIYTSGQTTSTLETIFSGKTTSGPAAVLDAGPATATVADRPVIKNIKIETRKVYPDFKGGNL